MRTAEQLDRRARRKENSEEVKNGRNNNVVEADVSVGEF